MPITRPFILCRGLSLPYPLGKLLFILWNPFEETWESFISESSPSHSLPPGLISFTSWILPISLHPHCPTDSPHHVSPRYSHLSVPDKYWTMDVTNVTPFHPLSHPVVVTGDVVSHGCADPPLTVQWPWASVFSCTKLGYIVSKIPCSSKTPHLTVSCFKKKKKMFPVGSCFQFYIWNGEHFQTNMDQTDDMIGEWKAQRETDEGVGVSQFWEGEPWEWKGANSTMACTPLKERHVQEAAHASSPFRKQIWTNRRNFSRGTFQLNLQNDFLGLHSWERKGHEAEK